MRINYHTHTVRCRHARGTEREYIEAAIANGIQVLGFSDHTPYPTPQEGDWWRPYMKMEELSEYVNTLLELKREYKNRIELHIGLEAEYFPAFFGELLDAVRSLQIEYLIMGQHKLGDGRSTDIYSGTETKEESVLEYYYSQVLAGAATGSFTYIAHPDVLRFEGERDVYERHTRDFCRRIREMNLPLEINFLGIQEERRYPREDFWRIAGEEGCDAVYGLDAHSPGSFQWKETWEKAEKLREKYRLHVLEELALRRP